MFDYNAMKGIVSLIGLFLFWLLFIEKKIPYGYSAHDISKVDFRMRLLCFFLFLASGWLWIGGYVYIWEIPLVIGLAMLFLWDDG